MNGSSQTEISKEQVIWTNFPHRGFALIGTTLVLFEILFLILYVNSFWLAVDLIPWGIPAAVALSWLAHRLLLALESPGACWVLSPIFKRRPPIIYGRWLAFDETSISFGSKRVLWAIIDEASLTIFGNLVLKTRSLCGPEIVENGKDINPADIIFKVPFGFISLQSQKYFVELLQSKRPGVVLNQRLTKQIHIPVLRGIAQVQGAAVIFLALVLMDFGYSNFRYLELIKHYYLSDKDSLSGTASSGLQHYEKAEDIRLHPFPVSWISRRVMSIGKIAAGIDKARSEALWDLGRKEEAVKAASQAAEQEPKSFNLRLRLARLYVALGKQDEAKKQIDKVAEDHEDSLLPRLYTLSMLLDDKQLESARKLFDDYMKQVDESVFATPPEWPPGKVRYVHELFERDDLDFIFERLLHRK
jgi:hypothetical protein